MKMHTFTHRTSDAFWQVVYYLNEKLPSDSLVETYESELFFMTDRRYHYPPDQVHVQLIRRNYIQPDTYIEYDPLAINPDYLVTGPFNNEYELYGDDFLEKEFRLITSYPPYEIYERVRK